MENQIIICIVFLLLYLVNTRNENLKCYNNTAYQNHIKPASNKTNNSRLAEIPRKDYIHDRHPYIYLIKELRKLFPINNPMKLEKWNSKLIKKRLDDVKITSNYIITQLEKRYQTIYFLIETRNIVSYQITDKYSDHFGKNYTIYDLIIHQDKRDDYFILNVHITGKDIIKVQFMTTETTDNSKLKEAYTGEYSHIAAFGNDPLLD